MTDSRILPLTCWGALLLALLAAADLACAFETANSGPQTVFDIREFGAAASSGAG